MATTPSTSRGGDDAPARANLTPAQITKLIRQDAETSKHFGVDFVPRRRAVTPRGATTQIEPKPVAAPVAAHISPARAVAAARVAKPATPHAAPAPHLTVTVPPLRERTLAPVGTETLEQVRARYEADAIHEAFGFTFTNIVFGEGDPAAQLMFIGEAPGEDEDLSGRPFVGRAGQLLEKMIVAMGLSRSRVYIANVLKVRPPNNATPTPEQSRLSAPYLFDQIAAIRPKCIVTLGLPATKAILGTTVPDVDSRTMASLRSTWATFKHPDDALHGELTVDVMPTYHPAYVLRNYSEETRAKVWSDLQQVMTHLSMAKK